jgi:hypothetical protein
VSKPVVAAKKLSSGELTKYSTTEKLENQEKDTQYYRLLDELYKPEIVQRALKLEQRWYRCCSYYK